MELENQKQKNSRTTILKKALCIFMTMLMLVSTFGGTMSVFATEGFISDGDLQPYFTDEDDEGLVTDGNVTIEEISLGESKYVSLEEDESAWFRFIPEADGVYVFRSSNAYDDPYATLYDEDFDRIAEDDDDGENLNFLISYYLYAGKSYYLEANSYDDDSYYVTVKLGAKAISFQPVSEFVLTEGISSGYYDYGYYDEVTGDWKDETYYHFNIPSFRDGDKLIVTEADDTTNVYVFSKSQWRFVSVNGETIRVSTYSGQDENPWKPGDTDKTFTVEYQNLKCSVSVKVLPNPVESISFTAAKEYIYTEGISEGYYASSEYYNEALGKWMDDEYFEYYFSGFNEGDKITAKMKDGSVKEYIHSNEASDEYEEDVFVSSDGEVIYPYVTTNQDINHWVVNGAHNKFTVNFAGASCDVPVTIKPNPVVSISFTPVSDFVLYEETSDGDYEYDDDDNEFYYYYIRFRSGDKITVKRADGSSTEYVYSNNYNYSNLFVDKDGNGIRIDCSTSNQYSNPWVPGGEHNYFTVSYASAETRVPVTVLDTAGGDSAMEDIIFVPAKEIVLKEGVSEGYYDLRYFEDENGIYTSEPYYYYYRPDFSEGDKISVIFSDGNTMDYYYCNEYGDIVFQNASGEKLYMDIYNNQDEHPFVPGGDYNYFILQPEDYDEDEYEYEVPEIIVPVTVQPSGVKSITFESSEKLSVIENLSGGYYDFMGYYYYNPDLTYGDKLTVKMENGTVDIYTYTRVKDYDYDYDDFVNEKGESLNYSYYNNQRVNPWTVGGEHNFVYIIAGGKIAEIPVEVKPNPYVSFDFVPAKEKTLIENVSDGYYEYCEDCGEEFYYYYGPDFETGDKIIAKKADGSQTEFVFDENYYSFISAQGDTVRANITDNQHETHWKSGADNTYYINLGDLSIECKVQVSQNNIKSVSFTPVSGYEFIEDISNGAYEWHEWEDENGDWHEERFYYYYFPGFRAGDNATVTYTDGKTVKYTYNDEGDFISDSGERCRYDYYLNQYDNPWMPNGEHNYFLLWINGYEVKVPVTVRTGEVDSVSFEPAKEYVLAENISDGYYNYRRVTDENTGEIFYKQYYIYDEPYYNDGDRLTVKLTDGTVISAVYDGNFTYDKGVLDYPYKESNQVANPWVKGGKNNYFYIDFKGKTCKVPVTIGDCAHIYVDHEAKAPTCTEKGWAAYVTCRHCDFTTYKEIPATGHRYSSSVTKAATCTAAGTMLYKCSCGASYTKVIPATGKHTPVTVKGTAATYKSEGKTDGSRCSVCGTVLKAQTAIAKLKLGKVSGLKAKKITLAKSSSVTLAWNKVKGAEKYEVYQQKGKKWVKIKTTSSTSLTVKKLKAGSTYKFKVRATVSGAKAGAYSSVLTVKVVPVSTSLKLKAGKKQITASWNAVSGVTGYEVQYSTSKNFKKDTKTVKIKKAKTKKTTIKKLTKGKKYYVRVRAYQKIGSKTYYGAWTVKNVKSK